MNVLRSIETRIESLVEGVFGRGPFRSHVQPVELARKLAKEMDDHKTISISRVYVPNEYVIYLAPRDREQFASYENSLLTELADYLSEHARREGYSLLSTPKVLLEEDDEYLAIVEQWLRAERFGVEVHEVAPGRPNVFGIVGATFLDVLDTLYDDKAVAYVNVRHEQAAAFMADGLVDEIVAYVAPVLLGRGRPSVSDLGITTIADALRLQPTDTRVVGHDIRITATLQENH